MTKKRPPKKRERVSSSPKTAANTAGSSGKVVSLPAQPGFQPWWRSSILLVPSVLLILCALDHIWVTEDAFITFKSVENLWAGFGPNFNRGLRVESFSHPLWFLILAAMRILGTEALPIFAAGAGIALSVIGLVAAIQAGRLRLAKLPRLFPLGALVAVSLPPFWDFASSGLETGLTFAWIGVVSLLLTIVSQQGSPRATSRLFWALGAAPLIRPDLAVVAAPLAALALVLAHRPGNGIRTLAARLARLIVPGGAWQIFRMGYYGLLIPNTYLAKEGFGSRWDQGLVYLNDLYSLYWLYPVMLVALALTARSCASVARRPSERKQIFAACAIPAALVLAGALHTLIVSRTGGDFMHARLLLPGLFCMLAGAAVVSLPDSVGLRRLGLSAFLFWMVVIALWVRPPYRGKISSHGIADERSWYVHRSRTARPVTLEDYSFHHYYRIGQAVAEMVQRDGISAVYWAHIGITVSAMPPQVTVIDPLALNDHIGSHITLTTRGRPGHEKIVRAAWFLARYPGGTGLVVRNQLDGEFEKREPPEAIEAAKLVLSSPPVAELTEAVSAPMSWELFWRNVFRAPRLTKLRIPADPVAAAQGLAR